MNGNGEQQSPAPAGMTEKINNLVLAPMQSPYMSVENWAAFLLGVLVVALLWRFVVRQVLDV